MSFFELPLSSGWTFKDRDDNSPDAWMSVPAVPSTVQQDLIANKRFYSRVIY
jgi:beta-mannosidase